MRTEARIQLVDSIGKITALLEHLRKDSVSGNMNLKGSLEAVNYCSDHLYSIKKTLRKNLTREEKRVIKKQ